MKHNKTSIDKKDPAALGFGVNWWYDPRIPDSFNIGNLDSYYENKYFEQDHVNQTVVHNYTKYVLEYGTQLLGRDVKSILELGCGGGWFTQGFIEKNINVLAVEGSKVGCKKTKDRIGKKYFNRVIQHDLRLPLQLSRQFDIAVCTEVAEHIEPPFAGQLVHNLISHTKVIWFSFEKPLTNEQHKHHPNEQPEEFWQNLFSFFDYEMLTLPKKVKEDVESRGGYIFYHKSVRLPNSLKKYRLKLDENKESINNTSNTFRLFLSHKLIWLSDKIARWADRLVYSQ